MPAPASNPIEMCRREELQDGRCKLRLNIDMHLKGLYRKICENEPSHLKRIKVRFVVIACFILSAVAFRPLLSTDFFLPVLLLCLIGFISNLISLLWIMWGRGLKYNIYFAISVDIVLITIALHYLGGIESNFSWVYVVLLVAVASLHGIKIGIYVATVSSLCYSALLLGEFAGIIPHVDFHMIHPAYLHEDSSYLYYKLLSNYILFFVTAGVLGTLSQKLIQSKKRLEQDVQERTKELTIANKQLEIIFEFAPDAYYLNDLQGTFVDGNKAAEELTGYSKGELIGKSILDLNLLPSDQLSKASLVLSENRHGKPTGPDEFILQRKDGRRLVVEIRTHPVEIQNQTLVLGIARDISDRKRAEEALEKSEKRHRILAENVKDVIWTMDLESLRFTYFSPSVKEMRGYTVEEAMKQGLEEVLTPASFEAAMRALLEELSPENVQKEGVSWSRTIELEQICKDGSTKWVEATVTFVRDSENKPVELLGVTRDISERKRADEAIRRSEEHFRLLIENALDAIGIMKGDGTILYESPSIERILGYKPEDVAGKNSLEGVHPDDRQKMLNALTQATNDPDTITHEQFRCRHRDGSWRVIETFGKRFPNTDNLVVNYRDITEQKQAEEALRKSEQEFRLTFESAKDAIIWADPETGLITNCNKATEILLEKDRADIIGHNQTILHPPEKSEYYAEMFKRHLQEKGTADEEAEVITSSGKIVPVHITASVSSVAGRTIMQGIFRDITEQKRAEEELLKSERSYRLLAENVSDVIWTMDFDLKFHYVSPSTVQVRGYSIEEVLSQSIEEVVTPDSLERAHKALAEELAMEEDPQRDLLRSRTIELEQFHKNGSTIWTETKMTFIRDLDNRAIGILGVTRDITEQRQLRQQLLQAQKMESIGTLAGGIAHDFNNILGGILGYASFMKSKVEADHPFFKYLDTIERSSMRAAELTAQLLGFARRGKYETRPLNLNEVVKETLAIIERTISKSIAIEARVSQSLPTIEADAGQLQQVLMNLFVNAADAMPAGGRLIVETDAETLSEEYARLHMGAKPGSYVRLSVTDTGIGMDKETQQRIFEPFFTTKKDGKGTGLGLAMVYGVIKNHEGYISLYSELGHGTTFKIYIPVSGKAEDEKSLEVPVPYGRGELILVVDDEKTIRDFARVVLETNGYRVILAEDGEQAVRVFEEHNGDISLVILDMVMPNMGGHEAFLRMRESHSGLRALLSSGYSQNGRAQEILDSGVMGFLQKPYQSNALLSKVRSVIDAEF